MGIKRWTGYRVADLLALTLRLGGEKTYRNFLDALWERFPAADNLQQPIEMSLVCPGQVDPDPADREFVERIFRAYQRATERQQDVDAKFQPSSMWKNIIRDSYGELTNSLETDDVHRFHRFLANFGGWPQPTAIEESWLIQQCADDPIKRRHFEEKIMAPMVRWWLRLESNGRDLSALEMPRHGNFGGVSIQGHVITPGAFGSEIHSRMLARFLRAQRPVIAELGGGFGRLFYFLSRHLQQFCYVGFDLPEILCCASYYLMKSFPEKRFLLYGEQPWETESLSQFDFLLLPAFEIDQLPDDCIDLFINENSLGNIAAQPCHHFIAEICRSAKSFWHRNHEARRFEFDDGTTTLLNQEYPIPREQFEEVLRYADVTSLVRADRLERQGDMYWYYYRRRKHLLVSAPPAQQATLASDHGPCS